MVLPRSLSSTHKVEVLAPNVFDGCGDVSNLGGAFCELYSVLILFPEGNETRTQYHIQCYCLHETFPWREHFVIWISIAPTTSVHEWQNWTAFAWTEVVGALRVR